ncbi:ArsR/SmtB family transcription factor [Cytobacillus sp. Hm23]
MKVLNTSTAKRESYAVKFDFSLMWESALGIAAITYTEMLSTLDQPQDYWDNIFDSITGELSKELDLVQKENTWKALLQLLHESNSQSISEFTNFVLNVEDEQIRFYCLPYMGNNYEQIRTAAAKGDQIAIQRSIEITSGHKFFPHYIKFIANVDISILREHVINVLTKWYEEIVLPNSEHLTSILTRDVNLKKEQKAKLTAEEFVSWVTGGIEYLPEPTVTHVLLIPHFIYRPWTIEAKIKNTKIFYYPVHNDSIHPNDKYVADHLLMLKHKALGDVFRLKILKLLFEKDRSLQELTTLLDISKSTIHHHLSILRSARLVLVNRSIYSLNIHVLTTLDFELKQYLNK